MQEVIVFEQNFLLWIQENIRREYLTPLVVFFTTLGNGGGMWIVFLLGLMIKKDTRKIGVLGAVALGVSFLVNNLLLKNLIARPRPFEVIAELICLIPRPTDYSFPSGHTGSSFAVATVMMLGLPKRYGIIAMGLAFFMGLSRLYIGVHFLSDVVGGAVIGGLIGIVVYTLGKKFLKKI